MSLGHGHVSPVGTENLPQVWGHRLLISLVTHLYIQKTGKEIGAVEVEAEVEVEMKEVEKVEVVQGRFKCPQGARKEIEGEAEVTRLAAAAAVLDGVAVMWRK